jgi:alpha-tubulin suppressor-like RCC1 family protein
VLALKSDGTVWSWGSNSAGQLGYGAICGGPCAGSTRPRQVPGLTGVAAVAAGGFHSLALKRDGTLLAWGQGGQGQLGTGVLSDTNTPTRVPGLGGVQIKSIVASVFDSMIVTTGGGIWGWGLNGYGEVRGDGSTGQVNRPFRVTAISAVKALAQGKSFTLALKTDGTVWAWGRNDHGQLGRGSVNVPASDGRPARVPGLTGITAVAAGHEHAIAVEAHGGACAWAWGRGTEGQLGGTGVDSATPRVSCVTGISSGDQLRAITAGGHHTIAIAP